MNLLKFKYRIVIFVAILLSITAYSQNKNKLSASIASSLPLNDYDNFIMPGIEFQYERVLNRYLSLSFNLEFDRYNNFPKFANGGMNSGLNPNPELVKYIYENVRYVADLWDRVNQQIISVDLNFFPLVRERAQIYISGGIGLNIQDAINYGVNEATVKTNPDGSTELLRYLDYYSQRSANTLVVLTGLGYDYKFLNNWSLGANIRLQLPLIRDKAFFKYGGVGFDETARVAIKVGKSF